MREEEVGRKAPGLGLGNLFLEGVVLTFWQLIS